MENNTQEELQFISIQCVGFSGLNAHVSIYGLTKNGDVYYKHYPQEPWKRMNMTIEEPR